MFKFLKKKNRTPHVRVYFAALLSRPWMYFDQLCTLYKYEQGIYNNYSSLTYIKQDHELLTTSDGDARRINAANLLFYDTKTLFHQRCILFLT